MNSGIIDLIILVSILGGILVLILMKSMFEEKKLKKLIGQDLTFYTKEELLELEEKYERYDYSSIFKKESERIRVEFENRINNKNVICDFYRNNYVVFKNYPKEAKRIRTAFEKLTNNKNDNKNMIVFDPHGEPYNDFKKEI